MGKAEGAHMCARRCRGLQACVPGHTCLPQPNMKNKHVLRSEQTWLPGLFAHSLYVCT